MKKLQVFVILSLIFSLSTFGNIIDPEQEIFAELSTSFKSGNVKEIAKYFAKTVDVTLPSSEDQYSKSQAEIVLKNFFDGHTPAGFTLEHQGASNNGKYMVGSLMTSKGIFKVYVFVRDIGGQKSISELKIETP
ncbi:MAG: DUF4783 domain-containing protein [Bacteroidetes bacterium]|nr:DUF4783 domain-containing protein [Bacteroidota bacterium]